MIIIICEKIIPNRNNQMASLFKNFYFIEV